MYPAWMKHHNISQDQKQKPVNAIRTTATADSNKSAIDFAPPADEVARRAYFGYLNQGSPPGHDVQHWLKAEAELITERNLTREHAFHNKT
jgi:hypothetical protein